jgi:hypothetical protein
MDILFNVSAINRSSQAPPSTDFYLTLTRGASIQQVVESSLEKVEHGASRAACTETVLVIMSSRLRLVPYFPEFCRAEFKGDANPFKVRLYDLR